jgi:hypothetical protein
VTLNPELCCKESIPVPVPVTTRQVTPRRGARLDDLRLEVNGVLIKVSGAVMRDPEWCLKIRCLCLSFLGQVTRRRGARLNDLRFEVKGVDERRQTAKETQRVRHGHDPPRCCCPSLGVPLLVYKIPKGGLSGGGVHVWRK